MTKKELEEKIQKLEDDNNYIGEINEKAVIRIEENIQYISEELKKEKNEQKKKLLLGLKNEFLFIKSLLNDETVF